jgi:hypothetical protein
LVIDGTLIPIDRVAADRPFYSGKHCRHGMNLQVIATSDGEIVWVSGPLPGAVHDLTAARIWGIMRELTASGLVVLADKGYHGAGDHIRTPYKGRDKPEAQKAANRVHAKLVFAGHLERLAFLEFVAERLLLRGQVGDPGAHLADLLIGCQVQLVALGVVDGGGFGGAQRLDLLAGVAAAQFGVGGDGETAGVLGGVLPRGPVVHGRSEDLFLGDLVEDGGGGCPGRVAVRVALAARAAGPRAEGQDAQPRSWRVTW